MPDLAATIRQLSPAALRLYKQQLPLRLKTMSPENRRTILTRLQGIPELADILGGVGRPAPQVPTQPPQREYKPWEIPEDLPSWQKGLQTLFMPFTLAHEYFAKPIATGLWGAGVSLLPGEQQGEAQLRQAMARGEWSPWHEGFQEGYEEWDAPWGAKFALETLPWFAIPGIGKVGAIAGKAAAGRGIAGMMGRVAPRLGRAAPLVRGAAKALEYSPYGLMEKAPGAVLKAIRPVIPPGIKIVGKVLQIPKTKVLLDAAKAEALPSSHWLLKIPGVRKVLGAIKASWVADDPIRAANVIKGQMDDMTEAGLMGALARGRAINPNIKVIAGLVDDPLIKQIKKLPGEKTSMAIHDIIEYSARYKMPVAYRKFVNEIRSVSKSFSNMAKGEGLKIRQIVGEGDFAYLHRVVVSVKEDATRDLAKRASELLALQGSKLTRGEKESGWAFLSRIMDDVSAGKLKPEASLDKLIDDVAKLADVNPIRGRIDKPRFWETVAEGMKAGIKYADDPVQELKAQGRATYDLIIKKRMGELLRPLGVTKAALIEAKIGVTPAVLRTQLAGARKLVSGINRARRGEVLPSATIKAIEKQFPEIGTKLREALKLKGKIHGDTLKDILPSAQQEIIRAQGALTRAMRVGEQVVTPEMGRVIGVPGISGRFIPTQVIGGKSVMGTEIAREINRTFGWAPPGVAERWMRSVGTIGGTMRMAKASLDMSAQFIQTLPILGIDAFNLMTSPLYFAGIRRLPIFGMIYKPSAYWAKGVKAGIKAAINPAKAEAGYWANPINRFFLQEGAKYGALAQPSELVEYFGPALTKMRKIPRVGMPISRVFRETYGRAEAAFTATRNVTANEYRKGMWQAAKAMGQLSQLSKSSNLLTGVLSTKGMGISAMQRSAESGLLWFSPRFTRSVPALFGHMLAHPASWTGREAMKAITGLMIATTLFFSGAAMAMGQKPKLNPLPKSMGGDGAEWLTVKVGDRFVGLGGILSDIRAAVNVVSQAFDDPSELLAFDMSNPALRRLRAKFAPPTSAFYDYMVGRDFIGNPVRGESLMPTHETALALGKWGLPIWVEGMMEEGVSLSGILGEFFGGRTFPESEWDIYKNRMLELSGKKSVKDISYRDRIALQNKYPELAELKEVAQDEMRRRGYNPIASEYWDRRDDALMDRITILEEAQRQFDADRISGSDIRRLIQDTGLALGTQCKMLERDERYAEVIADMNERSVERTEEALEKGWAVDLAYQQYWSIMFNPDLVDALGEPLYAERDRQLDLLRRSVGGVVWQELQEWLKESRQRYPFIVRKYYDAQTVLKPYWDIEDQIWARHSPQMKQIADRIRVLESTDPRAAKRLQMQYPEVLYARRQIALLRRQMKLKNRRIAEALRLFYG